MWWQGPALQERLEPTRGQSQPLMLSGRYLVIGLGAEGGHSELGWYQGSSTKSQERP